MVERTDNRWSLSLPPSDGGEGQPTNPEAALRALQEQRARVAAGIGDYFYDLVMRGQLRDPAVIALCRPLYDIEQQIARTEADLRASGSRRSPAVPNDTGGAAGVPRVATEGSAPPAGRPAPGAARRAQSEERHCLHCRMPLRADDALCPVCGRSADAPDPTRVPHCHRCGTALRPQDAVCPVCGTARP